MNKNLLWLIKNKSFLQINRIEQALELSQGTIKKFVDGKRPLNEQWHERVIGWVREFKK